MKDEYSKQVTMKCPVCMSTSFNYDPDIDESSMVYKCISCEQEFSKDELLQANTNNIDENLSKLKKEVMKDATKEIKKTLKDAFRGNKNIKIK